MSKGTVKRVIFELGYVMIGLLLLSGIAAVVMELIQRSEGFLRNETMMFHIYRAESIVSSIQKGCWYPFYDEYMYNGIEAMRHCPPLTYYCLVFLRFLTSSMSSAAIAYLGFIVVLGGTGWLAMGIRYKRHPLSLFVACLWFFVPENLRVLVGNGNLPRGLVAALLPWLFFFLCCYLQPVKEEKRKSGAALIGIAVVMALLVLTQTTQANIIVIVCFVSLLLYSIMNHSVREMLWCMAAIVVGYALSSLWLYPYYKAGGMASPVNLQTMASSFFSGFQSLNPCYRIANPNHFYYGLSFFLLSLCGALLARNHLRPIFLMAIFVFCSTTLSAYPILSGLPGGTYFMMDRYVTIVLGMVLVGILLWKQLKRSVVLLICFILVADVLPSLTYFTKDIELQITATEEEEWKMTEQAMEVLKEVTGQRAAVMDLSTYTSFVPYFLGEHEVQQTFGAEWRSATTASNIVMLNEALTGGYYYYLFDRCVELGNDTVLIPVNVLANRQNDIVECTKAANRSGYQLIYDENDVLIYKIEPGFQFGTINEYPSIAIGTSSSYIALLYPEFEEATDACLTNYTVEELSKYEIIYLSGFTYQSKAKAESMIEELAALGCQIYVDMATLPHRDYDVTGFFDVSIQNVLIREQFPILSYDGKNYYTLAFQTSHEDWSTVFLSGLVNPLGSCNIDGVKVDFYGTVKENIHLLGFNLIYYTTSTKDIVARTLMNQIFHREETNLPTRLLVPVKIQVNPDSLLIQTEYDNVNTTIAYQEVFTSNQSLASVKNLLTVQNGTTSILFQYPYWHRSLELTGVGVILLVLMSVIHHIRYRGKRS